MEIQFDYNDLYDTVARSLSIIGKRARTDEGKRLFDDITLSSLEKPLATDYLRQAVIDLSAELAFAIESGSNSGITITLPSNYRSALNAFVINSCKAYCVSYALYSWFTVTFPRIAPKYQDDCVRQLNVLKRILHEKKEPTASSLSYEDITGELVSENNNDKDNSNEND